MITQLNELDHQIFLYLNSLHSPYLDDLMVLITKTFTWLPFYGVLIFFLYKKFKTNVFYLLLAIGLTILFADQFASAFMKPLVGRLRPCQVYNVHILVHCGQFGFISSHAANTFALAYWIANIYKKNWIMLSIFSWATLVSYSRIYVGVHYPADLIFGALAGLFWAFCFFGLWKKLSPKFSKTKI